MGPLEGLVFAPAQGIGPIDLSKVWRKVRSEAELPNGIGLHGLRHSLASHMAMNGAAAAQIMTALGHKQLATAQKYVHWAQDARQSLAEKAASVALSGLSASRINVFVPIPTLGHPKVLDLPDISNQLGLYQAHLAVWSVMGYRKDRTARQNFLSAAIAHDLAPQELGSQAEVGPGIWTKDNPSSTDSALMAWFEQAGGLRTLTNAPPLRSYRESGADRLEAWFAAGAVLSLVARVAMHHAELRGGASINKAVFILERVLPPHWRRRDSRFLRGAWSAYRPVAHFCAAFFNTFQRVAMGTENSRDVYGALNSHFSEKFAEFLAESDMYQEFGLSFVPSGTGSYLLDPSDTWMLPERSNGKSARMCHLL